MCALVNEMTEFVIADSFWVANMYIVYTNTSEPNTEKHPQLLMNIVTVQLLDDELNIFQLFPWNFLYKAKKQKWPHDVYTSVIAHSNTSSSGGNN